MTSFFRGFDMGFACSMNNMFMNNMFSCGFMPCSFNVWNFNVPFVSTPMMNFSVFSSPPGMFTQMPMTFSTPMFNSVNTPLFSYAPQNFDFGFFGNFGPGTTPTQRTNSGKTNKKPTSGVPHYTKITEEEMQRIYGKQYDYDVTTKSNLTAEQINKFIETKYPKSILKGKGQAFIDAENTYGISALAMLGICGAETGFGTTGNAKNSSHNIVNIQRPGYKPSIHGKDRWKKYDSADDCIMDLARILRENFVDSSGNKQVPHFKKLYQINAKYCPASEKASQSGWAKRVTECMNEAKKVIGN